MMKTPLNLLGSRLRQLLGLALMVSLWTTTLTARADLGPAEKPDLRLGFIKLTDMAPLAVAWEQGFFMDEGLFVELEAQANWKVLLDRVITGELDGAHMLAGQPLGASIGYGTQADIITAFSMDLNGNGITVANDVWDIMRPHIGQADGKPAHPISASALVPVVEHYRERGEPFRMGMVFPVSTHNYELRYWLAAGGLNPGFYAPQRGDTSGTLQADVHLSVTPPPQMPATMEAGTIQGYCVGEPWNQQAVFKGIGVPVITDYEIWASPTPPHPISAEALKPVVESRKKKGDPLKMGMVFPVSTHNYEIRYWLAASGIHPGMYTATDTTGTVDADVLLSVTPPPQMPATLEAGTISGYCVGEPWNQQAVVRGIGVPVTTNYDIWKNNPEKVFGVTRQWAEANPNTHLRLLRALIRAAHWLDQNNNANREQAVAILARPSYVGADAEVIANSMTGTFEYQKGDVREVPDFNVFFRYHATYPYPSDAIWYLSQMRRWGQIPEARPDSWYLATAARVYRGDIYQQAAQSLIRDGILAASDFPDFTAENFERPHQGGLIDGVPFTPRTPNAYIDSFAIGLKGSATP